MQQMRENLVHFRGYDLVSLSCEALPASSAREETVALLAQMNERLRGLELSLNDTVRTRLWGKDEESRDKGSVARMGVLKDAARSSSSSYVDPSRIVGGARVAIDLIAMRPALQGTPKTILEFEPAWRAVQYTKLDDVVFLSGLTSPGSDLAEQMSKTLLGRILPILGHAGAAWKDVVHVAFYHAKDQNALAIKREFHKVIVDSYPILTFATVADFPFPNRLVEIEVTAVAPP